MDQLNGRIWIGDQEDSNTLDALSPVRSVVCLERRDTDKHLDGLDAIQSRIWLQVHDREPIPFVMLNRFLRYMREQVIFHGVLIHCHSGSSRAPMFAIAWLMRAGFSWDEAEAMVRDKHVFLGKDAKRYRILKDSILAYFGEDEDDVPTREEVACAS